MLRIGITGGIGSGKTTVCKVFETMGIKVYYADLRAKELMVTDPDLRVQLIAEFGNEVYFEDGTLNRKLISEIVFKKPTRLKKLESYVHPTVFKDEVKWLTDYKRENYVLKEAAILFESGGHKLMDKNITVFAPEDLRIERVMQRDGSNKEQVVNRIKNQMSDNQKIKLSDYVIYNDGKSSLVQQIWRIHHIFSKQNSAK